MLPKEAIEKFKELYLKRYGVKLSDSEATKKAYYVFNFFKQIIFDEVDSYQGEITK